MFVDEISIQIISGDGGDGCTSFHREKSKPLGGPDGGNGGRGSNIIFQADESLKTLIDLRYKKIIKGHKGTNGKGNKRNGANAEDIILKVPVGTTIIDENTSLVIADLLVHNQQVIVAAGGRGGRGNKAFVSNLDTAPKFSEKGEPGVCKFLKCELKVLADVGLVGLPSVGKSTILSVLSNASVKIAAYHFTTLTPNLGVVNYHGSKFVIADLPGLIKGASQGIGLGDKFLRHAMRCKIIAHVIDMASENPIEDYLTIYKELENYNSKLVLKEEIIIANKMDLENALENLNAFKKAYPQKHIIQISAQYKEGLDNLLEQLTNLVSQIQTVNLYEEDEFDEYYQINFNEQKPFTITKDNNLWILKGAEIEKLFKMTKFNEPQAVERFARKLKGMGVDEALYKAGAKAQDEVQILDYIFELKE